MLISLKNLNSNSMFVSRSHEIKHLSWSKGNATFLDLASISSRDLRKKYQNGTHKALYTEKKLKITICRKKYMKYPTKKEF